MNQSITSQKSVLTVYQHALVPSAVIISSLLICSSIYFSLKGMNFANNSVDKGPLFELAEKVGADGDKLLECIENNDFSAEILADIDDAKLIGVNSTPSFLIGKLDNGKVEGILVTGAQPYATFEQIFNSYLGRQTEVDLSGYKTASITIDEDPKIGNQNAKIAVVEFSDYECPYCKQFHLQSYKQVKSNFVDQGDILYVYKDFPLSFHDPKATEYAIAANCVQSIADDETYFEFGSLIFQNTATNGKGIPE